MYCFTLGLMLNSIPHGFFSFFDSLLMFYVFVASFLSMIHFPCQVLIPRLLFLSCTTSLFMLISTSLSPLLSLHFFTSHVRFLALVPSFLLSVLPFHFSRCVLPLRRLFYLCATSLLMLSSHSSLYLFFRTLFSSYVLSLRCLFPLYFTFHNRFLFLVASFLFL